MPYFARRMSRNQRIGLIVAAVAVAVVAFVIASPGGDDERRPGGADHATTQTETQAETDTETETETQTAAAPAPPKPEVTRIQIRGGEVAGGPADDQGKNGRHRA